MKQRQTRDEFIHNLQGERSDKAKHNIMILGNAVFDLQDSLDELHGKFDEILARTKWLANVGPEPFPISPIPPELVEEDEGVESF